MLLLADVGEYSLANAAGSRLLPGLIYIQHKAITSTKMLFLLSIGSGDYTNLL